MAKLVVTEFVSLDGVMEDPGGAEAYKHGGWTFKFDRGPEGDKFKLDELDAASSQLLGRVTYQGFAKAWPNIHDEQGFADRMNSLPKFVASTTLQEPLEWNSTLLEGDVLDAVAKLKEKPGEGILNTLMPHKLIDEYRFMIYPLVLGTGKRFFRDGNDKSTLELKRAETSSTGVTMLVCEPAA